VPGLDPTCNRRSCPMSAPRLYTYFRSGAAHRVRIALALTDQA